MVDNINPKRAAILGVILAVVGLYNVTQAGMPAPVFQNDGYAVFGGVLLFTGGLLIGLALAKSKRKA